MKKMIKQLGVGAAAVLATGSALAAVDATAVVTEINSAGTATVLVATAVMMVIVGIAAFKYIRRAIN